MKENHQDVNRKAAAPTMILAGDVGGTKTLIGLFERLTPRPRPIIVGAFSTLDYESLASLVAAFMAKEDVKQGSVEVACFGVAGPVLGDSAELTNVAWRVETTAVASALHLRRVTLLNDLHAMAFSVPVLHRAELHTLQEGEAMPGGNMALIAAGTGLGEALLHFVDGRYIPSPSEAGHGDFAARNNREVGVMQFLTDRFGRAEVEQVVSGRGILNLHRFTHTGPCPAVSEHDELTAPAAISAAALERRCPSCVEALTLFVSAYGAESGNLALRSLSTGGLFIGGGIAPKILPALVDGRFLDAFRAKAPFEGMLTRMPVHVILNPEAGLLGAAVYAAAHTTP